MYENKMKEDFENKTKEDFENENKTIEQFENSNGSIFKTILYGFRCLLNILALILAFTTNKEFNIGSVIVACCCPIFYLGLKTVKHFRKSKSLDSE
jgi:hypothetical protein